MSDPPTLAAIETTIRTLLATRREMRRQLRASAPIVSVEPEEILIDTTAAAARFNYPKDTVRWLAANKGLGVKQGGRWMVDVRAFRAYLDCKHE